MKSKSLEYELARELTASVSRFGGRPIDPEPIDPGSQPALFARSYLAIRRGVGLLGLALPVVLIALDKATLDGAIIPRDSLSSYYHSGARDFFVATLCIVGYLLIRYMWAQWRVIDFWLSLLAGISAILVAIFPTRRPGATSTDSCDATEQLIACTPLQAYFDETPTFFLHLGAAGLFLGLLGVMAFRTAYGLGAVDEGPREDGRDPSGAKRMAVIHVICGCAIVLGICLAVAGVWKDFTVGKLAGLWLGEVIAVAGFAASWLLMAADLKAVMVRAGLMGYRVTWMWLRRLVGVVASESAASTG